MKVAIMKLKHRNEYFFILINNEILDSKNKMVNKDLHECFDKISMYGGLYKFWINQDSIFQFISEEYNEIIDILPWEWCCSMKDFDVIIQAVEKHRIQNAI
jgi:hypothetical protein